MTEVKHDYAEIELLYNKFTEPAVEKALKHIKKEIPDNPRIVDAGCGPGSHFHLFDKVFDEPEIVAVDISQPHLEKARERREDLEADIKLVKADLEKDIPLEERGFDLVWFGDVICLSDIENPSGLVANMKKYLKDGGILSVFYGNWLRQSFMPGYARLEQKINAAYELMHETRNIQRSWQGSEHPEKALKWLKESGYRGRSQEIFPVTYSNPEKPEYAEKYVRHVFQNDYYQAVQEKGQEVSLTEKEKTKWHRISNPENTLYLPSRKDYFCYMPCTVSFGKK